MWIRIQYALFNFNDFLFVEIVEVKEGWKLVFRSLDSGKELVFRYDTFRECKTRLEAVQEALFDEHELIDLNDSEWFAKDEKRREL